MITPLLRSLRDATWHPSDEQLVAHVDAELEPRETARVEAHLARCWTCRARRQRLEKTIGAFMQAYSDAVLDDLTSSRLDVMMTVPRAAVRALRDRARALPSLPSMPTRSVMVRMVAACATVMLVVLLSSETRVSARQLVRQVDRVEKTLLDGTRAPVVYQRLEIARRDLPGGASTTGTWEVWTDVRMQRRHSLVAGRAAADTLFALFDRPDMRDAWPVSLRAHQHCRARDAQISETVSSGRTAAGEQTLTLDTTADQASGVVRAALVVRQRDWHPVEQRLLVRHRGGIVSEFVVRESHFEVLPLASLPVAFFDPAPASPLPTAAAAALDADALATTRVARETDLVTAEVQAMYALHRFGVTAADDLTVHRLHHQIEVSGVTTTDDRRKQLTGALARIPFVRARIRTAEEALAAVAGPTSTAPSPTPLQFDAAQIQADRLPAHAGPADAAAMARARDAVRHSLALLERAWALRRLAEWATRTGSQSSHVTRNTRELIDLMAREHAEAAAKALAALDTTVSSSLPTSASASGASAELLDEEAAELSTSRGPGRAWADLATDFFGVAAEIDRDTRRLFTASAAPPTNAADEAQRLRRGLDRAARYLDALQRTRP